MRMAEGMSVTIVKLDFDLDWNYALTIKAKHLTNRG